MGTPAPAADNVTPAAPGPGFTPAQIAKLVQEERAASELKARLDQELKALAPLKDEYEKLKGKLKDDGERFRLDPAGVLEDAGVPRESWLEVAEQLFFSLDPDKATPELRHRIELRKEQRNAEKWRREVERKLQEERERMAREIQEAPIRSYMGNLDQYARSLTPDKSPAIAAWFEGDHQALVQTMMETARNLAAAAEQRREQADLSPERVAREVESYLDAKFSRRFPKPTAAPTNSQPKPPAAQIQSPAGISRNEQAPQPTPGESDNSVEARERRAAQVLDELWRSR